MGPTDETLVAIVKFRASEVDEVNTVKKELADAVRGLDNELTLMDRFETTELVGEAMDKMPEAVWVLMA